MARQRRSGNRTNNRGNSRSNRRTGRRTTQQRRTTASRGSAPKRNRPNRRKSKSRLPLRDGLIWFGGGVGIGILLLLPLFLFTGDDEPAPPAEEAPAEPRPTEPEPAESGAEAEPAPEAKDAPQARKAPREDEGDGYRFYTLLPNMEVEVPSPPPAEEEPPSAKTEKEPARPAEPSSAPPRPTPEGQFLLQVASFQQADDAEAMKARLALRGLQAKVVDSDLGEKGTWYRVRLGPFAGRAQAEDVRDRLKRAGLRPMVMRQ